jgi:DNA polymerase-3 subunit beta
MHTSEAANAIKMASLFARESANNIKLKITAPDKIEVLATSSQVGSNVSTINGTVKGDNLEIAFNAKFILDCLSVINSEKITLEMINNVSPGVIKGKEANYLYVIMPLRVDE